MSFNFFSKLKALFLSFLFIFMLIIFGEDKKLVGVVYKQVDTYYYGKVYVLLRKGDVLDVYRSGVKVGRVSIYDIDANKNVLLTVIEGQIMMGDELYGAFERSQDSSTKSSSATSSYSSSSNSYNSSKGSLPYDKLNDALRYYSNVLASRTKVIKFGPNSNTPTKVVIDPMQLLSLYSQYESYKMLSDFSNISGVSSYVSTYFLLNLLNNLWNTYQNVKGPTINNQGVPDSFVQVVFLDYELAKARTLLHGYKEAIYDKNYLENYYRNLVSSTNLDDFFIFEITVFNSYNQPLPLSPFSYKIYLIGEDGRRYRVIKYDASLDSAVPPGGTVSGFVYFAKYDIETNKVVSNKVVRLSIEEIGPIKQEVIEFK